MRPSMLLSSLTVLTTVTLGQGTAIADRRPVTTCITYDDGESRTTRCITRVHFRLRHPWQVPSNAPASDFPARPSRGEIPSAASVPSAEVEIPSPELEIPSSEADEIPPVPYRAPTLPPRVRVIPAPSAPAGGPAPAATECARATEAQVLGQLNQSRLAAGLQPLRCDAKAAAVARAHSQDMCSRRYFSHLTPEGTSPAGRLRLAGMTFRGAGENIAVGYRSAEAVHTGWMQSTGHRRNILDASWTGVGVGLVQCEGRTPYWTQVFVR